MRLKISRGLVINIRISQGLWVLFITKFPFILLNHLTVSSYWIVKNTFDIQYPIVIDHENADSEVPVRPRRRGPPRSGFADCTMIKWQCKGPI